MRHSPCPSEKREINRNVCSFSMQKQGFFFFCNAGFVFLKSLQSLSSVIEELKSQNIDPGTPEAVFRDAVNSCVSGNVEVRIFF